MKRLYPLLLLCVCIVFNSSLYAQEEAENERLFHLCQVWGYYKYFHPSLTSCNGPDWDIALIQAIEESQNIPNNQAFNIVLERLENYVSPITPPQSPSPDLSKRMTDNLNLEWLEGSFFSSNVKANLQNIKENYRPGDHCKVTSEFGGILKFPGEKPYSSMAFPREPYRLLALFRFWNVIRYFYPYTHTLDKDWEETLREFIPKMRNVENEKDYQLVLMTLFSEIKDSHSTVLSPVFDTYAGFYYAPFELAYVDGKTLIKSVLRPDLELETGDVVTHMNGITIDHLRDSMRVYAWGREGDVAEIRINEWLVRGPEENFEMTVEDDEGARTYEIYRGFDFASYERAKPIDGLLAQRLPGNYGYVDAARLDPNRVNQTLINLQREEPKIKTLILDLRNIGPFFFRNLAQNVLRSPGVFALQTQPDIRFPGTSSFPFEQKIGIKKTDSSQLVILLIDETTVGAGEMTTMALEAHNKVIKVGSPTAGSAGEGLSFLWLPGGVSVLFNSLYTSYPDGEIIHHVGIQPDIYVRPSVEDVRTGRDAVLDAAILEAKSSIKEVSTLVFPNPSSGELNLMFTPVSSNNIQIDIFDVMGRIVKQHESSNAQAIIRLDVSDLQQGRYIIRTIDGENVSLVKFEKI